MRIGTWNVEYAYPKRLEAIRSRIAMHPADIWILTETHDDLSPDGCPNVAYSLPRPKNWNGIRSGSRWVSIWSAFPIVRTINLEGADAERTVVAKLDVGSERPLVVYGTVLPWKGDREVFNWDEHHRVIEQQSLEWKALRALYPDADLVIAGDYNTDLGRDGITEPSGGSQLSTPLFLTASCSAQLRLSIWRRTRCHIPQ